MLNPSSGGKDISWHVGYCCHGTVFWWVPGYDELYAALSPGKFHIACMIAWAFEHGCHTFDFMRGREAYKSSWTDGQEFELYDFSLRNMRALSLMRSSAALLMSKRARIMKRLWASKT